MTTEGFVRAWLALKRFYRFLLPLRFSFLALIAIAFAFLVSAQGYDIIVASNLHVDSDSGEPLADSIDLFEAIGGDVRVSTAVDNSTRFTYVSPAGTLLRGKDGNGGSPLECAPGQRCEHVVDGGYFENSGSATLSDVLTMLSRSRSAARTPTWPGRS